MQHSAHLQKELLQCVLSTVTHVKTEKQKDASQLQRVLLQTCLKQQVLRAWFLLTYTAVRFKASSLAQ